MTRFIALPTDDGPVLVNPEWVAAVKPYPTDDPEEHQRAWVIFGASDADLPEDLLVNLAAGVVASMLTER